MCEFCELCKASQETAKDRKANLDIDTEFVIRLVENKYKNGKLKGSLANKEMRFYYCPICGRKLSEVSE